MRTYTAHEIARYFLAKADAGVGDLISNLKLQKLCYYAQGVGTATRGQPLFEEPIEAWLHGPVVPQLYHTYSSYGREAIPAPVNFDIENYELADRLIMDDVYDYYGQYSAWRLRQMTHDEPPWKNVYDEGCSNLITIDALKEYFSTQIDDDYRRKYGEQV
ncbi:Panacea domain-containing protein [Methylobacterium sp. NPDC080182]|uniref:Panacea domain-containing protein n=1 Tax=unclassified Methylobacterium TaxID=2615210 RepID=UPI0008A7FD5B|nr:type II toxin-antitoxin system antitoxin SocA domain-containing protein [Methylobacterium sp. 275MFSha3.1]SEI08689.1 Uncharacterized phage-associated protein [Methylobacterium sp. 275MFSha3.1]